MVSKYLALNIKIFYIFFLKKEFKNYFWIFRKWIL
jgi:hypothetical protein